MLKIIAVISLIFFGFACTNSEHHDEFDKMKSDLDDAVSNYCDCMTKADTLESHATEVCQDILNKELLDKCGMNEVAHDYVKEEIKKCIEKRIDDEEQE